MPRLQIDRDIESPTEALLVITRIIHDIMDMTFKKGAVVSCKEMSLAALHAACPALYAPKEFKQAIQLIEGIDKGK